MIHKYVTACFVILILCNSCATHFLWEKYDPNEYVIISTSDISEEELKDKGLKFYRDNCKDIFYVEKDANRKLKDYSYRVIGTPITVVVDVVSTVAVIVVGVMLKITPDDEIEKPSKRDSEYYEHRDPLDEVRF